MIDNDSTHDVEIKYDVTKAEHDEIFDSFCVSKKSNRKIPSSLWTMRSSSKRMA